MARPRATSAPTPDLDGKAPGGEPGAYTVVARRYRPQTFEDVVGQDHVVQALRNAIRTDRVAQAYLFSGTRGVGKTSMARIFAKALNCQQGPTDQPCLTCDICQAIAVGQDVDVIEIDGASNNGVDAVRELRQNANLRPSRSRFKIYYIDEVHMLSTSAFNALLKTLEEPPSHVKFFFATTEASKIPITVLSRCQRFDFAGIAPEQIVETLADICTREQVEAEPEALQLVARRAAGSMRDAQSLLEQLLSSGGQQLTADSAHRVLGTAADETVLDLIEALASHDAAAALRLVETAVASGVQPADLLGGALEFLRDALVLTVGADVPPLAASPSQRERLRGIVGGWSSDSLLAALQILAEARGRLRGSQHGRLLVELALVRVARLEDLAELGNLVSRLAALEAGLPAPAAPTPVVKKKPPVPDPAPVTNGSAPASSAPAAPAAEPTGPTLVEVQGLWASLVESLGDSLGPVLKQVQPTAIPRPNLLVIALPPRYNWVADRCDTPEGRTALESAFRSARGWDLRVRFERAEPDPGTTTPAAPPGPARGDELAKDPMVQKVIELFEARAIHVDAGDGPET